jgi:hypothetical protein
MVYEDTKTRKWYALKKQRKASLFLYLLRPIDPCQCPKMSVSANASAPGKTILFGEHAVVYGIPAIAVALSDLRISFEVVRMKL